MNELKKIINKKSKLIIGLISGTSADGIDAALVRVSGFGEQTKFKLISFLTLPYPKNFKNHLLKNSEPNSSNITEITKLNILISHFFADAVFKISKKSKIPFSKIDFISSHGQTVHHLPKKEKYFGKIFSSTLQLGDLPTLAKLTGKIVVGNFRTSDMALGGQGAPLVPYFDWITFKNKFSNRAVLNIGGISNITFLPSNCNYKKIIAFDTGPGNMIIDALTKRFFNLPFDKNGSIANSGKINSKLLKYLMSHRYFSVLPPKSTGREMYGKIFVDDFTKKFKNLAPNDLIATATEFTALSIFEQTKKFFKKNIDTLIVSGGGAKNKTLINSLQKYFYKTKIVSSNSFGVDEDAKEAICFAILGNQTINGYASNVPSVTGAKKSTILGEIAF